MDSIDIEIFVSTHYHHRSVRLTLPPPQNVATQKTVMVWLETSSVIMDSIGIEIVVSMHYHHRSVSLALLPPHNVATQKTVKVWLGTSSFMLC